MRLRRGAVDLVGEDQIREERALLELELMAAALAFDQHVRAADVGGHHVRRELDARKGEIDGAAEGADEVGLAQSGNALEQHVAAREERHQDPLDDFVLADDRTPDLLANAAMDRPELRGGFLGYLGFTHESVSFSSPK